MTKQPKKQLNEISKEVSKAYYRDIKLRKPELFSDLTKIANALLRYQNRDLSSSELVEPFSLLMQKHKDVNALQSGDTIGVKMFLDVLSDDPDKAGQAKRFYDNVFNSLLKKRYERQQLSESVPKTPVGPFKIGQFRGLKTTKERVQYLKTRTDVEFISYGSSRIVYSVGNDMVIKLSKWNRGKAQNKTEHDAIFCGNQRYLPGIYAKSSDFSWILVEAVRPLKSAREFESLTGIPIRFVEAGINFKGPEFRRRRPSDKTYKKYAQIFNKFSKKSSWYRGLINMAINCDLIPGDVGKWDSWGVTKRGRVVLIDYGLNEDVWKQYYARSS